MWGKDSSVGVLVDTRSVGLVLDKSNANLQLTLDKGRTIRFSPAGVMLLVVGPGQMLRIKPPGGRGHVLSIAPSGSCVWVDGHDSDVRHFPEQAPVGSPGVWQSVLNWEFRGHTCPVSISWARRLAGMKSDENQEVHSASEVERIARMLQDIPELGSAMGSAVEWRGVNGAIARQWENLMKLLNEERESGVALKTQAMINVIRERAKNE